MKRPIRCANCGAWILRVYTAQTVCCVGYDGPRWIDDPKAAERYREYRQWVERMTEEKTR